MQFLLLTIISLASVVYARNGHCAISYHDYGNGQISGACDYYSEVSKYGGYITANTLGLSCFSCVQMKNGGNTIHVTVVDTGGMNFDLNHPAFYQLCGDQGINDGQCTIDWTEVSASNCIGNPNGGQSNPPPSNPPPSNPPPNGGGGGSVRCGNDWNDANSKCGSSCSDDSHCGGAHCYASLSTSPCSGNSPPPSNPPPSNPPPSNSGSTTRCGLNWGDANSNCKGSCSDDSHCGGQQCWADLNPCSKAVADPLATSLPASSPTSDTQPASADTFVPAWAIALIVVGSLLFVGLIVIIVQVTLLLRQ